MSVKALGIALKLTFQGDNQLVYPQTSVFAMVVITCVLTQMNYLNKVCLRSPVFRVLPIVKTKSKVFYMNRYCFFSCERPPVYKKMSVPWWQALDTFNTAVVSPIYYVMFTSLTILASVIMFKVSAHLK